MSQWRFQYFPDGVFQSKTYYFASRKLLETKEIGLNPQPLDPPMGTIGTPNTFFHRVKRIFLFKNTKIEAMKLDG